MVVSLILPEAPVVFTWKVPGSIDPQIALFLRDWYDSLQGFQGATTRWLN